MNCIVVNRSPLTLQLSFWTLIFSTFCQTPFVERVMSFVLGKTNTLCPPCFRFVLVLLMHSDGGIPHESVDFNRAASINS